VRFSKTAPVKIIILGAGGTGGYVIPQLYRLALFANRPVRVIVCDGDTVEHKNLLRQNFIEQDIGQNKAKVLAERYANAFGIAVDYIPDFIEDLDTLNNLLRPDNAYHPYYSNRFEEQRVILIGAVDNNRSRWLCHEVFRAAENLVYIDSGNGESAGQVVFGVKQKNRTLYKPVCSVYPDMLRDEDKFPSELSCAERSVSAPQSVTANLFAATAVVSFLYNLLIVGEVATRYVTFSSRLISARAEISKPRKKVKAA